MRAQGADPPVRDIEAPPAGRADVVAGGLYVGRGFLDPEDPPFLSFSEGVESSASAFADESAGSGSAD